MDYDAWEVASLHESDRVLEGRFLLKFSSFGEDGAWEPVVLTLSNAGVLKAYRYDGHDLDQVYYACSDLQTYEANR